MKKVLGFVCGSALLLFSTFASADVAREINYTCRLSGNISGASVAFVFGGQILEGPGRLSCVNGLTGETMRYPVTLRLAGAGVGFDLTAIRSVRVYSSGIGVNDPQSLYRSFGVGATAGANLIRSGVSYDAAVRASESGLNFELGFQGKEILGLGAHLYGMIFSVRPR